MGSPTPPSNQSVHRRTPFRRKRLARPIRPDALELSESFVIESKRQSRRRSLSGTLEFPHADNDFRSVMLRRRSAGLACATVAAAGLLLSGCGTDDPGGSGSSSSSSSSATSASTSPSSSTSTSAQSDGRGVAPPQGTGGATAIDTTPQVAPRTPTAAPPRPDNRCTNQTNYAGDPRSNAEINSLGEKNGTCPAPVTAAAKSCTDQLDYAGDPRSNAEINSLGEKDGKCPAPIAAKPSS